MCNEDLIGAIQGFFSWSRIVGLDLQGLTPDPLVSIKKVSDKARQFVTY